MGEVHEYHESLLGFHPSQVLRDGCPLCERRGKDPLVAVAHMDSDRFAKAWARMQAWDRDEDGLHLARCELKLMHHLKSMELMMERHMGARRGETVEVLRARLEYIDRQATDGD